MNVHVTISPNTMKTSPQSGRLRRRLALAVPAALALLLSLTVPRALAQAFPNPPERMSYQGFLVDGDGVALGNDTPKNYDVVFSIWNDPSGGNLLWAEQQTVTVDKGYFSVLLGEGASTGDPRPALSTLFKGTTASDRFVAITVKGIGGGGGNVDILPRLRLLSSPYAFFAQQAVKLVQENGNDLVTSSGNTVTVHGSLSGNGSGLTQLNANNMTLGTLPDARIPNLPASRITSGAFALDRIPNINAERITSGTINNARLNDSILRTSTTPHGSLTFQVLANYTQLVSWDDATRTVVTFRPSQGLYLRLIGGHNHGTATRDAVYDGDSNWDFYSDIKLKKDVVDVESLLERALQVRIRRYRWKDEDSSGIHKLGVIAQELRPLFPQMVSELPDPETSETTLAVGYSDFGMIALKALQELKVKQDAELAELRALVSAVALENAELRRRLDGSLESAAVGR